MKTFILAFIAFTLLNGCDSNSNTHIPQEYSDKDIEQPSIQRDVQSYSSPSSNEPFSREEKELRQREFEKSKAELDRVTEIQKKGGKVNIDELRDAHNNYVRNLSRQHDVRNQ